MSALPQRDRFTSFRRGLRFGYAPGAKIRGSSEHDVTAAPGLANYVVRVPVVSEAKLRALMVAALAGDARAYQALLSLSAERLRAYFARRLPGRTAEVEDLVQETLTAIHRKRASYSPALPFTAWLHAIARYRLIDHLRREGRRATVPLHDLDFAVEPQSDAVLARIDVDDLLAQLSAKQRDAIRLTRLEGYSTREAAERSGQSEASVKVNVHRGLGRLINRISGRD